MRKILLIVLIVSTVLLIGCGDDKSNSEESDSFVVKASYMKEEEAELKRLNMSAGTIIKNAFWVDKEGNVADFLDAWNTRDDDFFKQQIIDGKIFHVDKVTRIYYSNDRLNNGKIVRIQFLQGRYKNKTGYTLVDFIY